MDGEPTLVAPPDATRLASLIREQSASEVDQITAEMRQRVDKIRATAKNEAAKIRAEAEREGEERGQRRAAELLAVAEAESRSQWLRARENLIQTALERARAQLAHFADMPAAAETLAQLIREAMSVLPNGPLRVQAPADYAALLAAVRRQVDDVRLEFQCGPGTGPGGVIIESSDARRRFDNSFDARIHRRYDELRRAVADALSGAEHSGGPPA
jgi:vacuolar-type H+-ATPase subunit E/Vma4